MNLTQHFPLREFTRSQAAARLGREIVPTPEVIEALIKLCVNVLQPLRFSIGVPITVTSGYRPDWLNTLIGGSKTSQHVLGEAADIVAVGYMPMDLCERIVASGLPFDQLICEFDSWVHVSYSDRKRGEVLTARSIGGKTVYLKGLVPK